MDPHKISLNYELVPPLDHENHNFYIVFNLKEGPTPIWVNLDRVNKSWEHLFWTDWILHEWSRLVEDGSLPFVTFNQKQRRTRDRFKPLNFSYLKLALSYLSYLISFFFMSTTIKAQSMQVHVILISVVNAWSVFAFENAQCHPLRLYYVVIAWRYPAQQTAGTNSMDVALYPEPS